MENVKFEIQFVVFINWYFCLDETRTFYTENRNNSSKPKSQTNQNDANLNLNHFFPFGFIHVLCINPLRRKLVHFTFNGLEFDWFLVTFLVEICFWGTWFQDNFIAFDSNSRESNVLLMECPELDPIPEIRAQTRRLKEIQQFLLLERPFC